MIGISANKWRNNMANGYWIILFDGWGMGLNMIEPRMFADKEGNNWFTYNGERPTVKEIREKHGIPQHQDIKVVW